MEEVCGGKTRRELATRLLRSSPARPSRSGREDGLHPYESRPQGLVRTGGRLDVDLSATRPSASAARVGLRRAEDCPPYLDATIGVAWVGRVTPCAPLWTWCESTGRRPRS